MKHFIRRRSAAAALCAAIALVGAGAATNQPADHLEIFPAGASGSHAPLRSLDFSVAVRDVAVNDRGEIFVTDPATDRVLEFAPDASGSAKPVSSISGASTSIVSPSAIATDARGDLFVANEGSQGAGASITIYASGARGNVSPARTIAGGLTALTDPVGISVDAHGAIYVIDAAARDVLVFAPGASGDQAPVRRLSISGFMAREIAIGPDDILYVFASDGPHGAEEIASFLHGSKPQAHAPITGRGVYGADWISVDRTGFLYVISPGRIYTFAPKASGAAEPAGTLEVDYFLSNCCARMTAGADGKLYVYLTAFHWAS